MIPHKTLYGNNEPRHVWMCVIRKDGRYFMESYGSRRILLCVFRQNGAHGEECGWWHATRLADQQQPEE